MKLVFQPIQDGCCVFCNPVRLADFERNCVGVGLEDSVTHTVSKQFELCYDCIQCLQQAADLKVAHVHTLEPEVAALMRRRARRG